MAAVKTNKVSLQRYWRDESGQGMAIQYAFTFILVVAATVSMSVYVQRALKGRIRSAHTAMINYVREENQSLGGPAQTIYTHYEPYYAESDTLRTIDSAKEQRLDGSSGAPTGIYSMSIDKTSTSSGTSKQFSPLDSDQFPP